MQDAPRRPLFSAAARRARLDRAAGTLRGAAFLHERAADDLVDRLETVLRPFPRALLYGPGAPFLAERLTEAAGVGEAVLAGESARLLTALGAAAPIEAVPEAFPFEDGSFDLVVSSMSLHAADDLPAALVEARRVLRPDGLLLAVFPGERTLQELRGALQAAEAEVTSRVAPRVIPMVAVKDAGALLQRAGLALPVADTDDVTVSYRDPLRLLRDLRAMGETSVLTRGAKGALRRDVLAVAMAGYPRAEDGTSPATFQLVHLAGWSPHESQPKPLKPGSAKVSLKDAIGRG
jgi:SAM-dependent methyltransferase